MYIYINSPQVKIYLIYFIFTQLQRSFCLYTANPDTLQWWTCSYTQDSMLLQAVWRQQKQIDGGRNRRIPLCQKMNKLNLPDMNPSWHKQGGIKEWATFDNPCFTALTTVDGRDYLQTKWLWVKGLHTLKLNTAGF